MLANLAEDRQAAARGAARRSGGSAGAPRRRGRRPRAGRGAAGSRADRAGAHRASHRGDAQEHARSPQPHRRADAAARSRARGDARGRRDRSRRSCGRSRCCGRRGRCGANGSMSPTKWKSRSPTCATCSCRCCRRSTPAGSACWPQRPRSFLRLGSWIGGDRDGNPNVTADSLRLALRRASQTVLEAYLDQLHALGADLSISTELADADRGGGGAGRAQRRRQPGAARRAVPARDHRHLRAARRQLTSGSPGSPRRARRRWRATPYASAEQFRADLVAIAHSLGAAGEGLLATGGALGRLIRAVETCGFHLATLDLRQNADVHARVVADLLRVAGVEADYLALDEAARVVAADAASSPASGLLASPFAAYADETASELAIVHAAAEAHALYGPASITTYIMSKCESVSDLLEVNVLLKEAGLYRPSSAAAAPIMVVPLFETIGDLADAPRIMREWLSTAGGRRGRAIARLSGGDGRLLRLQQGRRLPDLGVEPAPGHAGAGASVRRSARRDADLSRPRRRRRPRRRLVVRRDSRAAGRARCRAASASPSRAKSSPPSTARARARPPTWKR